MRLAELRLPVVWPLWRGLPEAQADPAEAMTLSSSFESEVAAVRKAMMAVENAQWTPVDGDPRNLDPEDEPLVGMRYATTELLRAVGALDFAARMEIKDRERKLDEMSDADYDEWEKATA